MLELGDFRRRVFEGFPIAKLVLVDYFPFLRARPIDLTWNYDEIVPISVSGFNPLAGSVYFAELSHLSTFLFGDDSLPVNRPDWYLYEIFFAVHDFLHVWSASYMLERVPECIDLHEGLNGSTARNLAYILMMSELSAVVGLDYWMLSHCDVAALLGIDVKFKGLTTSYRAADAEIAREFWPDFEVRDASFFDWLARGYFDDDFGAFDLVDAPRVANKLPWVRKEWHMGVRQRQVLARWLDYLRRDGEPERGVEIFSGALRSCSDLSLGLCEALWSISSGQFTEIQRQQIVSCAMPAALRLPMDFRCVNVGALGSLPSDRDLAAISDRSWYYFVCQRVSGFRLPRGSVLEASSLNDIIVGRDLSKLRALLAPLEPLESEDGAGLHLLLPN